MSARSVVRARGLRRRFGEGADLRPALDGVSLEVTEGELLVVVGPSGSGKSTLLAICGGLDRGYEGSLALFERPVEALSDDALSDLRSTSIGFVFQSFHLLAHLSILDNVLAPSLFTRAPDRAGAEARARALLARLGLAGREGDLPRALSGGQRQRAAIARALFVQPRLLLCDEPTGNLDAETGARTIELLRELHGQGELTVIAVTHEERLARIGTRVIELREGRLAEASS